MGLNNPLFLSMEITDKVRGLIDDYLEENGIELVEITYKREQNGMALRLLVDTPEGITINECEKLNNYLNAALDNADIINEHYLLEVSSPGLDRPILTDKDFERSIGKVLDITTYQAIDGRKTHEGKLIGIDKDNIVIESNGISTVIPRSSIARARFKIEF